MIITAVDGEAVDTHGAAMRSLNRKGTLTITHFETEDQAAAHCASRASYSTYACLSLVVVLVSILLGTGMPRVLYAPVDALLDSLDNSVDLLPSADVSLGTDASSALHAQKIRLAIVTMSKHPPNLDSWLAYHWIVLGAERFYLRIEDTPSLQPLLAVAPWADLVDATFATNPMPGAIAQQMQRQVDHVVTAIAAARKRGMSHLLHIDDDEMLYAPSGVAALHAALRRATAHTVSLKFRNVEALVPTDENANPFATSRALLHAPPAFTAYTNGKSMGVLSAVGLQPLYVHGFTGAFATNESGVLRIPRAEQMKAEMSVAAWAGVVVHYESSSYSAWARKHEQLARHRLETEPDGPANGKYYTYTTQAGGKPQRILPFMQASIEAALAIIAADQAVQASAAQANAHAADDDADDADEARLAWEARQRGAQQSLEAARMDARSLWRMHRREPPSLCRYLEAMADGEAAAVDGPRRLGFGDGYHGVTVMPTPLVDARVLAKAGLAAHAANLPTRVASCGAAGAAAEPKGHDDGYDGNKQVLQRLFK